MKEFKRMIYRKNAITNGSSVDCFSLIDIQFTDPTNNNVLSVSANKCPGSTGSDIFFPDIEGIYSVNQCININTLLVSVTTGVIQDNFYTTQQIQDAIVNNNGDINKKIFDGENIIGNIRLRFGNCSSVTVVTGLISNSTVIDPTGACEILTPTEPIKIQQQVIGLISQGDVVLNVNNTPFIGNGDYYNISAINSFEYIVQVNSNGIITQIFQNCAGN